MANSKRRLGWMNWITVVFAGLVAYVLSSGPVLSTAFWLRERTHHDEFYLAMWLYLPLWFAAEVMGHEHPLVKIVGAYIEWWVKLFGTVGPG